MPEKVIVRDFSFTPRATVAVPAAPTKPGKGLKILVSVAATPAKGVGTSTLNWIRELPDPVCLLRVIGTTKTAPNTGGLQRDLQMRRSEPIRSVVPVCARQL